ncbi:hypothetical protein BKA80DRAFT_250823 [Phyllosticta citrichinensis]
MNTLLTTRHRSPSTRRCARADWIARATSDVCEAQDAGILLIIGAANNIGRRARYFCEPTPWYDSPVCNLKRSGGHLQVAGVACGDALLALASVSPAYRYAVQGMIINILVFGVSELPQRSGILYQTVVTGIPIICLGSWPIRSGDLVKRTTTNTRFVELE